MALQANLHGVLPVRKATFGSLQQSGLQWGNRLKQMFAACHSLNMVTRSAVAGADMERSLFKAVEASFLVGICLCIVALPYLLQTRSKVRKCPTSVYKGVMESERSDMYCCITQHKFDWVAETVCMHMPLNLSACTCHGTAACPCTQQAEKIKLYKACLPACNCLPLLLGMPVCQFLRQCLSR